MYSIKIYRKTFHSSGKYWFDKTTSNAIFRHNQIYVYMYYTFAYYMYIFTIHL